ncbi:transposase [Nonomuraea sp. NPDC004297]
MQWRARTGVPRRDVPACYGPWQTVYGRIRRWQREGVWAQIITKLQTRADAAGLIGWQVSVDSTSLLLPQQPRLPAPSRHRLRHPRTSRSDPQPQETGQLRRPASGVRCSGLQGPACGRVWDQPAQAPPRGGHAC